MVIIGAVVYEEKTDADIGTSKLPQSALMIYFALREEETYRVGLKPGDISKKTSLSPRTVRYGLKILVEHEIIGKFPDLRDLRSHHYRLLCNTSNLNE